MKAYRGSTFERLDLSFSTPELRLPEAPTLGSGSVFAPAVQHDFVDVALGQWAAGVLGITNTADAVFGQKGRWLSGEGTTATQGTRDIGRGDTQVAAVLAASDVTTGDTYFGRWASGTGAVSQELERMFSPTDTYFAGTPSWHWSVLGNIKKIWDEFTGTGVKVGVYDDGVEYTHADLDGTYDASRHLIIDGYVADPMPAPGEAGKGEAKHGTSVAGLIAAEANGAGAVGVAFGSRITGVDIFQGPASSQNADQDGYQQALLQMDKFDITNNSWGYTPLFASNVKAAQSALGFAEAAMDGRGGLGTIVVKSAGNAWDDGFEGNANGSIENTTRYSIIVAASGKDGDIAAYSSRGSNVLVTGSGNAFPGNEDAVFTTDRQGSYGYNDGSGTGDSAGNIDGAPNYTTFNGTSAAAPIVSGVVALMLDANPLLGWRDVQNILAASSTHEGSTPGTAATGREAFGWVWNGADSWNGGGYHFSEDWGYGQVNAYNAVRMAETWSLFNGGAQTLSNENRVYSNADIQTPIQITDGSEDYLSSTIPIGLNFEVEFVSVEVTVTHTNFSDLEIVMVAPDGQEAYLWDPSQPFLEYASVSDGGLTWTFGVNAFRGLDIAGEWTFKIRDQVNNFEFGQLDDLKISWFGRYHDHPAHDLNNDVYHYTDEVFWAQALEAERKSLDDTDGGVDWLNMAALTGNVALNLAQGASSRAAGIVIVTVAQGTVIENAVTGDGADTLLGNTANNRLLGMRGTDRLEGLLGNDTLEGGAGNDTLIGGAGNDVLDGGLGFDTASYFPVTAKVTVDLAKTGAQNTGGAGFDTLKGVEHVNGSENFGDTLLGNTFANRLHGYGGHDTLRGAGGNDTLTGWTGDDILDGGAGTDVLDGGAGLDTASYYFNVAGVTVNLALGGQQNTVGAGLDTLISVERLTGSNTGGDRLTGGAGANIIRGEGGADRIQGGGGADTIYGGAGGDTFVFALLTDSTSAARDRIMDYGVGDRLDLSGIDASAGGGTNTAFVTRIASNAAFTGAGQYRLKLDGTDTLLELNTDGDTAAEAAILLIGNWTAATVDDNWVL